MSKRPRVLVLCGTSPRHLYVANALCAGCEVVGIVHERGGEWTWKKVRRLLRPAALWRKVARRLRDRGRYADGGEARFFFGDAEPTLARPELVRWVPHINHPSVVDIADRRAPDVIAVFGTALIRGPLLERGRLGMLNLHGGLSPEYRGADCTFWALYNGEPEKIGCTLHFINAGIDTGNLVAHVCPAVGEGDDELTLFWRAVRDSAAWQLEERDITAPANGRIDDIIRRPGEIAGPSAPILSMLPDGAVKLRLYIPETAISGIAVGDSLSVRCDGCAAGLTARVSYVSDAPEFTPPVIYSLRNRQKLVYLIEARPDREAGMLKPGQIVDVRLPGADAQ